MAKAKQDIVPVIAEIIADGAVLRLPAEAIAVRILLAIRNPTKRMRRAACSAMSPGKRPTDERVSNGAKHAIRWRAMIDEAVEGYDPDPIIHVPQLFYIGTLESFTPFHPKPVPAGNGGAEFADPSCEDGLEPPEGGSAGAAKLGTKH